MNETAPIAAPSRRRRRLPWIAAPLVLVVLVLAAFTEYESYTSLYDASYVGSPTCGECHTQVYQQWRSSPHALMARPAAATSVVGDFDAHEWRLPAAARRSARDHEPAARMVREGDAFFMQLRHPTSGQFVPFRVDWVIGFQYRQTYLTQEPGGVLRRLPLQWSVRRRSFFPYWNLQERSQPSLLDLWKQFKEYTHNSAWNLFCARCHVTHLQVFEKDRHHTRARVGWSEAGIGCEACHGPGSQHVNYFATNYVNRLAAFLNSKLRGQPAAYVASAPKLTKGQDASVCARCHGPDIPLVETDVYRDYEPGYSKSGKINDLTPLLRKVPLTPGRKTPTVEVWDDGMPKGIGMLLRSFIESACWNQARVACYDCHDPHANKRPRRPGLLEAGPVSDRYCLDCHDQLADQIAEHTHHAPGTPGSFCYDCHMPHTLQNLVGGYEKLTRTHWMSSIPMPEHTMQYGKGAPNACNECHHDRSASWASQWKARWWE